jgi:hypothetical protein
MAKMTWSELIERCRREDLNLMTKELYFVFCDPTNGLGPVLENLGDHFGISD